MFRHRRMQRASVWTPVSAARSCPNTSTVSLVSHTTEAAWATELENHLADYASRAIITEFGVPMTAGINYDASRDGNNISYLYALTHTARSLGIGTVYWPAVG